MNKTRAAIATVAMLALTACNPAKAASDSIPESATLQLVAPQYQQTTYWCVSASAAVALAQEGVYVSQSTLAADFHTVTGKGVYLDIRPQLDALSPDYRFEFRTDTTSPRVLQTVLAYDIGVLRQPVMVAVDGAKLPWNSAYAGHGPRWHVEIAYGYDERAHTVQMWEVWGPTGGAHTVSLDLLASAVNPTAGVIEAVKK